ncbi:transposase [Telluribacter sp. SYSU D00476]|uniref:transposase n=1 Tax=Telluribacter sp. SYSU D00476 TaxID=2811430 RepID=UPI001FF5F324|nr:transposase [Telluribacter sp. SYSU D00476]
MVAFFRWYTRRGDYAQDRLLLQTSLLKEAVAAFGKQLWHIFDRGYAGSRWLAELFDHQATFVIRWPKRYQLIDSKGKRNAWKIATGKTAQVRRQVWDAHLQQRRMAAALALPVTHADFPEHPLWLVVSRLGKGKEPWYLLTNQPCEHKDQLWSVVLAYARRWQIEACFRFSKSELAIQSPRLWFWQNRLKLMMMVTLVYAFLLQLMSPEKEMIRNELLRRWCHRTGKRCQLALTPLYRLRAALAALFSSYQVINQSSG